jgi:hypothetical protein
MFMRELPSRGAPPRGSIQDFICCEMLQRERRRQVHGQVYLARIFSSGLHIAPKIFELWTTLYMMEVTHESYSPEVIEDKEKALKTLGENEKVQHDQRVRMFQRLEQLTATVDDGRPVSPEELEEFKRRLRKRHLKTRKETK